MSTVKTFNLQHPSSSTVNMTLASDGSVSGGLPSPNRNLLYNGAMQVAQRGTSATGVLSSGYRTADRWLTDINGGLGIWTQSVEADAPTGSGFRNSLKMLCTTNSGTPGTTDMLNIAQRIEGQDLQRIAKGTASAQPLTLSFWVKSNVTGTYTILVFDSTNTRSIALSYTVSASATWEKKVLTIAADTSGQIVNSSSEGLALYFCLGAGSNFTTGTLQTSWGAYTANRAVGQVNVAAAVNNYWQVTGVQLETGPAPTAFEFKPYAQELRDCQRYFERFTNVDDAALAQTDVANRPEVLLTYSLKRVAPTVTVGNPTSFIVYFYNRAGTASVTSFGGTYVGTAPTYAILFFNTASGVSTYDLVALTNSGGTGYIDVSAEL